MTKNLDFRLIIPFVTSFLFLTGTFASPQSIASPVSPDSNVPTSDVPTSDATNSDAPNSAATASNTEEAAPEFRDLMSDTWVATDALGRTTPLNAEVGDVKTDQRRVVGIFYVTWHTENYAKLPAPFASDVTKILNEHPEARLDANHPAWRGGMFHWGEPEAGYFLSQDEYVIRKDISMLNDAGVDVLILDVTNAVYYWDEWEVLFSTMEKMKAEGNKVPKFCFWAFNGSSITIVQNLFDGVYKKNRYPDLWFYWDGKPLILCNATPLVDSTGNTAIRHANPHYDPAAKTDPNHPHYNDPDYAEPYYSDYSKEVRDFFTRRGMWWGYYKWSGERYLGTEDKWAFGYDLGEKEVQKMKPEDRISRHNGALEEAAVTPAQHPSSLIGKSWRVETKEPELDDRDMPVSAFVPWLGKTVENPEGYGIYFQDRWDEALASNPQFLYINDWNEWTAGKYCDPPTLKSLNFMRRGDDATYFFVDQYNAEFNRCIQPMKDGYTDNYYMQMAQNIRRYKGVRPIPVNRGFASVAADDPLAVWDAIDVEYRDPRGDVFHRDHPGYNGLHYKNDSGRNDLLTSKVALDADNFYFLVETAKPLTDSADPNWMLLFVDADQNSQTGWFGYDYLINRKVVDPTRTTLAAWNPNDENGGSWNEIAEIPLEIKDNRLAVTVPRSLIKLTDGDKISFDFKWSDNPAELNDPISLCVSGDSAPNRRFNYRFIWEK